MARDLIYVNVESNNRKDDILIDVTIDNALFVTDDAQCIFFGVPAGYPPPHPVTEFTCMSNRLVFGGNINSLYCALYVYNNDNRLTGTITVKPALPVSVFISSYAGQGNFQLHPGQTNAAFKIPLGNLPTESGAERTSLRGKIRSIQPEVKET